MPGSVWDAVEHPKPILILADVPEISLPATKAKSTKGKHSGMSKGILDWPNTGLVGSSWLGRGRP